MSAHMDSGGRCLVYHSDHGPCVKCAYCNDWIEPSEMASPCPKYGQLSADYIDVQGIILRMKAREDQGEASQEGEG